MKLAIGCDHGGFELKEAVRAYLEERQIPYEDFGAYSTDSVDYAPIAAKAARYVASGQADGGILICGTGVGISLAANKVKGIRCCVCSEPYSAKLSKQHNNSNIIAFGARVIGIEMAKMIVDEWLNAEFMGGRHQTRVDMIMEIEEKQSLEGAE